MYELYYEDELIASRDTMEGIVEYLKELKLDAIEDNRTDMARFPEYYEDNSNPEDGVEEYMRDVYSVKLVMEFPTL